MRHKLDPLSEKDRLAEDRQLLITHCRAGLEGEPVYCEETTEQGASCFLYRVGDYSCSGRYRFVGYANSAGRLWREQRFTSHQCRNASGATAEAD